MAFTTSGQETEWALFLQPRSPHGAPKGGGGGSAPVNPPLTTFEEKKLSRSVQYPQSMRRVYTVYRSREESMQLVLTGRCHLCV